MYASHQLRKVVTNTNYTIGPVPNMCSENLDSILFLSTGDWCAMGETLRICLLGFLFILAFLL